MMGNVAFKPTATACLFLTDRPAVINQLQADR